MVMRGVIGLVHMMDQYELLDAVKQKITDHECDHRCVDISSLFAGQLENLRQKVKAHDAQEHAGGKAQNEVQAIAELERKQSAGKSRNRCRKRKQYNCHSPLIRRYDG